jgi:hypothetical protein
MHHGLCVLKMGSKRTVCVVKYMYLNPVSKSLEPQDKHCNAARSSGMTQPVGHPHADPSTPGVEIMWVPHRRWNAGRA